MTDVVVFSCANNIKRRTSHTAMQCLRAHIEQLSGNHIVRLMYSCALTFRFYAAGNQVTSSVENTCCMDKRQVILNSHVSKAQPFFFFLSFPFFKKRGVHDHQN